MPPVNPAPYEVIDGPVTLYVADVGTDFPDVGADPGQEWTKVGKNGDLNYLEEGVTMSLSQEVTTFRPLGSTYPRKAFRVSEDARFRVTLADVSLEALQLALNGNEINDDTPGVKSINLKRGFGVRQYAVLMVGTSAEGDGATRHVQLNAAVNTGQPEVVFRKGQPAGIAVEFLALEDDEGEVGEIIDEVPAT